MILFFFFLISVLSPQQLVLWSNFMPRPKYEFYRKRLL